MSYQPEISPDPIHPSHREIQRRAYEIYIARGGEDGHDLADWIMAEQELSAIASLAAAGPADGHAATEAQQLLALESETEPTH